MDATPDNDSMAKPLRPRKAASTDRHYVKEWRLYRGLTQEQLAARVERTRALITQIETGKTDLTEGMIYALAHALDCGAGDLFRFNPSKEGTVVDIADELRKADPTVQAEVLGYIRGLVAGAKH